MRTLTIVVEKDGRVKKVHRIGRYERADALKRAESLLTTTYPDASVNRRTLGGDDIWYVELLADEAAKR